MEIDYSLDAFCRNLLKLRKSTGLTQVQMARHLGISVRTLRLLEKGIVPDRLTCKIFVSIYREFGITPHSILSQSTDIL